MTACTVQCATYCRCLAFTAQLTAPHNTARYLLLLFSIQSPTHCPAQYSALLTPAVQQSPTHCPAQYSALLTPAVQHSEPNSLPHTYSVLLTPAVQRSQPNTLLHTYSVLLTPAVQHSEPNSLPHTYSALLTPAVQRSESNSLPRTIQCATYCCCLVFRAQLTAPTHTVRYLLLLFSVQSSTHCPTQYSALITPAVQRSEPNSLPTQYSALLTPAVQRSEPNLLPRTIQCATYCCCSVFRAQLTAPHNTVRYLLLLFSVQSPTHCPAQYSALLTPAVQH